MIILFKILNALIFVFWLFQFINGIEKSADEKNWVRLFVSFIYFTLAMVALWYVEH